MPIHWRSEIDIDEENRYGRAANQDERALIVTRLECADCGGPITETLFPDGHRRYDQHGVCSGMGRVWHRRCSDQE